MTFEDVHNPIPVNKIGSVMLRGIVRMIEDDEDRLDLSPSYQRPEVWDDDQASAFIGAFLYGTPVPPVYLNWKEVGFEVVDGKQRLTALYRFVKGALAATHPVTGARYYQSDLDTTAWGRLKNLHLEACYVKLDAIAVRELYLRLNTGGTPHTPEEIEKVRSQLRAYKSAAASQIP